MGFPAPTWALAFQPSQGTSFTGAAMEQDSWVCLELCFLSRKSNGGGDLVGARRFGRNNFVYSQWSRTHVTIGENGVRWTMGMETRCLGPPAATYYNKSGLL
uniref:Uncharacterized protein n=1 Tax=Oryza rufipogon TaxID=4529 RepID=A0A0E0PXT4_ORYRU